GAAGAGEVRAPVGPLPRPPGVGVGAVVGQPVRRRDDLAAARGSGAVARTREPRDRGWLAGDYRAVRARARLGDLSHTHYPAPGLHIRGADGRLSVDGARASLTGRGEGSCQRVLVFVVEEICMENVAHIEAMTVLAVGIIFGMGALGTAISFGILGGRFIEGSA